MLDGCFNKVMNHRLLVLKSAAFYMELRASDDEVHEYWYIHILEIVRLFVRRRYYE